MQALIQYSYTACTTLVFVALPAGLSLAIEFAVSSLECLIGISKPQISKLPQIRLYHSHLSAFGTTTMGIEMKFLGMDFGCAFESLSDGKFPEKDCLLPLISKLLGYCIVAASTTVKLPQILKILKHQSVRGLSVMAFELEVVGYTIALAYCLHKGLPFSAYGELAFLLIQAIILVAIIYYYSQPLGTKTWMKALLYCGVAPTILAGQIDPVLFEALYASQHAIFFFARVPQIWQNYSNKSTGALSFLTCLMNSAGSLVRVFTSIQEKAPTSVVLGSALGIVMNGTILSQIIIYQKPSQAKKEKKKD